MQPPCTLVILKPDLIAARAIGKVITRLENAHFQINKLKLIKPNISQIQKHYEEHLNKGFYPALEEFMLSGTGVIVMSVSNGDKSVFARMRKLLGSTDSREAAPGTLRGDFGLDNQRNVVHASESAEAAEREHMIWFGAEDGDACPLQG